MDISTVTTLIENGGSGSFVVALLLGFGISFIAQKRGWIVSAQTSDCLTRLANIEAKLHAMDSTLEFYKEQSSKYMMLAERALDKDLKHDEV